MREQRTRLLPTTGMMLAGALWLYAADFGTLLPGNYVVHATPVIDATTAMRIDQELAAVDEIDSVRVQTSDSSIHFAVKKDRRLAMAKFNAAVLKAAPHLSLNPPVRAPDFPAPGNY